MLTTELLCEIPGANSDWDVWGDSKKIGWCGIGKKDGWGTRGIEKPENEKGGLEKNGMSMGKKELGIRETWELEKRRLEKGKQTKI